MTNKTIDEKVRDLERKRTKTKPVNMYDGDISARVLDAVRAGEPIVATKAFHGGDNHYQPGDEINPDDWNLGRLAKMAENNYILPKAESNQGKNHAALRSVLQNKINPEWSRLRLARQDVTRAAAALALNRAEAKDLQDQLATAQSQAAKVESDLANLLAGDDISSLLDD